jgi:hypothetical protein
MTQTRRLAAILAADVTGYSRLMGADEEGTLERLKALRRELVDPKIAEHNGRIVKTTGDGMLVEFASVVDAVRCAAEVQRGMIDREPEVPDERRIEFRMGVNLGDIIVDGDEHLRRRSQRCSAPGGPRRARRYLRFESGPRPTRRPPLSSPPCVKVGFGSAGVSGRADPEWQKSTHSGNSKLRRYPQLASVDDPHTQSGGCRKSGTRPGAEYRLKKDLPVHIRSNHICSGR